ncbi:AAA family ATPase [Alicyclobacillus pomorum]|uniref:AAA family ATPase n=1 Tax=Alicyclobacillus pomorum TaxID=204470 RepID=UPI00040D440F|nr:AAA family ATPase [Alicyclobacillus pomorum]
MMFHSLSLYGVGRHNGTVLDDLGPGLTVVYGANESGKSTVLAGIRGILFGRLTMAERAIHPGRGASGSLVVSNADGTMYHLERALSRKSPLKITSDTGIVGAGQDVLKEHFPELSEVEDAVYRTVFSFQLAELTDLQRSDAVLARRMFSLGATGGVSPVELEAFLGQAAKSLFNPDRRARNARLNQCLSELEAVKRAWLDKRDGVESYERLQAQVEKLRRERLRAEEQWHETLQAKQRVQKRLEALPLHQALVQRMEALRQVTPHTPVTEEAVSALAVCKERIAGAQQRVEALVKQQAELEKRVAEMPAVHLDAEDVVRVHQLVMQSSGVLQQEQALAEKMDELRETERQRVELRKHMSPLWTDEALEGAETGSEAVASVQHWHGQWEHWERAVDALERQLAAQDRLHREQLQAYEAACRERLGTVPSVQQLRAEEAAVSHVLERLAEDEWVWSDGEREVEQLRRMDAEWVVLQDEMRPAQAGASIPLAGVFTAAAAVMAMIGATPTWLATHSFLDVGVSVVGIGALVFGLWWTVRRRVKASDDSSSAHTRQLRAQREAVRRALTDRMNQLRSFTQEEKTRLKPEEVRSTLRDKRRVYEADKERFAELVALGLRAQETKAERERQARELADARAQQAQVREAWAQWLRRYGLEQSEQTPASFHMELERVRQYKALTSRLREQRQVVETLQRQVESFCREAEHVLSRGMESVLQGEVAVTVESGSADWIPPAVSVLCERLRRAEAAIADVERRNAERQRMADRLKQVREALTVAERELRERTDEKSKWYKDFGVATDEQYAALLDTHAKVKRQEDEVRELQYQLYGMFGSQAAYEAEVSGLNEATRDGLEQELEACEAAVREAKQQFDTVTRTLNQLEQTLATWEDGPSALDLYWRVHQLEDEKRALAREYAVHLLALHLVKEARHRFEQAHRPKVLELASRWFATMTHGKYVQLNVHTGERGATDLTAVDAQGRAWPVLELSRGTQEQVYLALRLAVVGEYAEQGVVLPVILDDPLVNFDPHRLSAALSTLRDFAEHLQVVYLTCHRDVLAFAEADPCVQLRYLDDNDRVSSGRV